MNYFVKILIAIDQLVGTVLGGYPDETISAACYRKRKQPLFCILGKIIDLIFFWQNEHCRQAYQSEVGNLHFAKYYRYKKDRLS